MKKPRTGRVAALATGFLAVVGAAINVPSLTTPAAADTANGAVSLKVLSPTPGQVITGPDLPLHLTASGYRIDARYAGTPNTPAIGHYHEILDGNLVDMAPYRDGTRDTIPLVGVTPGQHTLTIVPARNDHSMIMSAAVSIPFTYAGPYLPEPAGYTGTSAPSIVVASPAAGATVTGSSFTLTVDVGNFVLCQECFGKPLVSGEGHWHVFLDQPMMANMLTMGGGASQSVSLKGTTPGWHTFWAVLVDNHHMPFMDPATATFAPGTATAVRLYVRSAG